MKILRLVDRVWKPKTAYGHCDIPCGIYETNTMLMAAHTVQRMAEIIDQLPENFTKKDKNTMTRCVMVKEAHAQLCKEQLMVLWADFFKPEHLDKFPDLHEKVWKAMKLCSDNKHNTDVKLAKDLEAACTDIHKMFEQVKVEPEEDHMGAISDNPNSPKQKLLNK